ncbi:beta-1,3-galactosyltransferase 2-like [Argonauta hians]
MGNRTVKYRYCFVIILFSVGAFYFIIYQGDTKLTKPLIETNETNESIVAQLKLMTFSKTRYPLTIFSHYLINNRHICRRLQNLTFIIIVHTAPDHFERRISMRQTWANKNAYQNFTLRIVFLLGTTMNNKTQIKINRENTMYHDLVQGDFLDSYRNLTHKGVLGFRWITENCLHATMVLKVDDDVFINMFKLYQDILPIYKNVNRSIFCHVRGKNTSPIFRKNNEEKWIVDQREFRGLQFFPITYCNGYAVFLPPDLIRGMYQAAYSTPFFWIDDIYLYGLLPRKIPNVVFHNLEKDFMTSEKKSIRCFCSKNIPCKMLVGSTDETKWMHKMWVATLAKLDNGSQSLISQQILPVSTTVKLKQILYKIKIQVKEMFNLKCRRTLQGTRKKITL